MEEIKESKSIILDDESKFNAVQAPILNRSPDAPENEWTQENLDTVVKWQKDLEIMSFIYSDNAEYFNRYINNIVVTSQLLAGIITLTSLVAITLGPLGGQWVIFGFNIGVAFISAVIVVLNALIKIYSWDSKLQIYTNYSNNLSGLWVTIESEINIGDSHRLNANEFIKRIYGQYISIKQRAPPIAHADSTRSQRKYKENIFENQAWNLKFNKLMSNLVE